MTLESISSVEAIDFIQIKTSTIAKYEMIVKQHWILIDLQVIWEPLQSDLETTAEWFVNQCRVIWESLQSDLGTTAKWFRNHWRVIWESLQSDLGTTEEWFRNHCRGI